MLGRWKQTCELEVGVLRTLLTCRYLYMVNWGRTYLVQVSAGILVYTVGTALTVPIEISL